MTECERNGQPPIPSGWVIQMALQNSKDRCIDQCWERLRMRMLAEVVNKAMDRVLERAPCYQK
jgi:hypothetical protein